MPREVVVGASTLARAGCLALTFLGCGGDPEPEGAHPPAGPSLPVCENRHGSIADGQIETVGSVDVTHRFRLASDICWHYVEAGAGDTVVFVHGFPESWWSWHRQLETLAADFHVVAIDMKAYGQTDKPDGDYHVVRVAEETFGLVGGWWSILPTPRSSSSSRIRRLRATSWRTRKAWWPLPTAG